MDNIIYVSFNLKLKKKSLFNCLKKIDFTNTVEKMDLKLIAENDEQEVVREVHEYFADFLAINQHVFCFNLEKSYQVCFEKKQHFL
jgi:vacuolar protein sorting-associated protein 45